MSNINNIISDRTTNNFKIIDHNGEDVLEVDANNDLKIGRGANGQSLCNKAGIPNVGGGGGGVEASGGTKTGPTGGYCFHYFTTPGPNPFTCDTPIPDASFI